MEAEAEAAALQATACGFTPVNPNLEDWILESDGDQTWGKFRQESLILLSQQYHDSIVEVYVPPHKNKLALSKGGRRDSAMAGNPRFYGPASILISIRTQDKGQNDCHCVVVLHHSRASLSKMWGGTMDFLFPWVSVWARVGKKRIIHFSIFNLHSLNVCSSHGIVIWFT